MKYLPLALVTAFCLSSCTQPTAYPDYAAEVDKIFAEWEGNAPGASMAIIRNGEVEYAKGYGMANMEYDIPNAPNSVFRIASTSKQFTAACIVLLAEQGELSLEDPLPKFFPDFPEYAETITLRQLLYHTSGIRDYLQLVYLAGYEDEDFFTDEDVMRLLINQEDLNFTPGEEYLYSNSGFWLLGQVVKQVSGSTLAVFADKHIFQVLGMNSTHFHDNNAMIVANRATGYRPVDNDYEISMTQLEMVGDGGIFTTVEDMAKWIDNYATHKVGSPGFTKSMETRGILNNGDTINYALGLSVTQYEGMPVVRHGGAFVGFRADMALFPEEGLAIVVFTNRSDGRPSQKTNKIADILFSLDKIEIHSEDKPATKEKSHLASAEKVDITLLADLSGKYYSNELQVYYTLKIDGDELLLFIDNKEISVLNPVRKGLFVNDEIGSFEFVESKGVITGFVLMSGRVKNLKFNKI